MSGANNHDSARGKKRRVTHSESDRTMSQKNGASSPAIRFFMRRDDTRAPAPRQGGEA